MAPSHYEEESEEENGGGEIESTSYSPPQQHYNHTNGRSAPSLISSIMEDLHIDEEYTGNGHDYLDEDMMAEEYYGEQSPPAPAYLLKDFEERKGIQETRERAMKALLIYNRASCTSDRRKYSFRR